MSRKSYNPQKAKIHRSYTVVEVAHLYDVTRTTVRAWCKNGLACVRTGGELLIYGDELRAFLVKRRSAQRAVCSPGTLYCLKCRAVRTPAQRSVVVTQVASAVGNVRAPCSVCATTMNRRISLLKLRESGFPPPPDAQADPNLSDSAKPSVKPSSEEPDKS